MNEHLSDTEGETAIQAPQSYEAARNIGRREFARLMLEALDGPPCLPLTPESSENNLDDWTNRISHALMLIGAEIPND